MNHLFVKTLDTDRLILRKLRLSDVPDMFEYTSNSDACVYLRWSAHENIGQDESFIKKILRQYETKENWMWGIELKEEKKLIGAIRMFNIAFDDYQSELSWILNPLYFKRGYMSEALRAILQFCFEELGFVRVQAKCVAENTASAKLMLRCEMKHEGTFRKAAFIKQKFYDIQYFAIIREDLD